MTRRVASRRGFLQRLGLASAGVVGGTLLGDRARVRTTLAQEPAHPTPDQALQRLMAGNARFVATAFSGARRSADIRAELARGQAPFAAVLACADSRVPPELIFDTGLGDLFVVRVAGNILGDAILGSIEYAAEHVHVPLVLVLGHQHCGAVEAAVAGVTQGTTFPGNLPGLVAAIRPAVEAARSQPGDLLDNAVRVNVELVVGQLRVEPELFPLVREGSLKIVGGYYDLSSGVVSLIA